MNRSIFLIGMMGCGKSTIAKLLAAKLSCPALDLDEDIISFEGRSIPDIFADVGEAGFRHCETAALHCVIDEAPCVVATGGGIVTREENIALMRKAGLVPPSKGGQEKKFNAGFLLFCLALLGTFIVWALVLAEVI